MSIQKFNLEDRRILQIGFGSIGSAMPQMYDKHLEYKAKNIIIIELNICSRLLFFVWFFLGATETIAA